MSTALEHWRFIDKLIQVIEGGDYSYREIAKFLYVSAFNHGYKHGLQDSEKNTIDEISVKVEISDQ